jgi:hypothetical protein
MKQSGKSVIVAKCRNFDYNVTYFDFSEKNDKIK